MVEWRVSSEVPDYEVSDDGHIRQASTKRQMSASKPNVTVRLNGKYVTRSLARLVATAFIPNPDTLPIVKIINGDVTDRRVANLKWASAGAVFEDNNGERKITKGASRPIWRVDPRTNERVQLYPSIRAAVRSIVGGDDVAKVARHVNHIGIGKDEFGWVWQYDNDNLDGEIWKDVPADKFERGYMASNKGRIRTSTGKIVTGSVSSSGYLNAYVGMFHRAVYYAWNPEADWNKEVNHKDGDKLNNAIENLEPVTRAENMQHAWNNGLATNIRKVPIARITEAGEVVGHYESYADAEEATGVNKGDIRNSVLSQSVSDGLRWCFADQL